VPRRDIEVNCVLMFNASARQFDVLYLSRLQRVIATPMQIVESQIVLKARTPLTLVLTSARSGAPCEVSRHRLVTDCVHSSIPVLPHFGIERILVVKQRIVKPRSRCAASGVHALSVF